MLFRSRQPAPETCDTVDNDCDDGMADLTAAVRLVVDQELLEIDGAWVPVGTFIHNNGEEVIVVD